jgi:alkylation response protein AidB-like acyl-CoA dehydrogenase
VDFIESEEQQLLRQSVAKLASGFGHSYYLEKARSGQKASELWQACGEAGFLGVNLPEQHGGGGQGISELAIVAEELSAAGCPLLLMVVSPAIAGTVISAFGNDEQKQRWLPGLASGESIFAFAITEPDAGSNSHKISVTATRDGDEYKLNGSKYYISGVDEADAILVVTRTGIDESSGRGKLSLFVVPTDSPGLKADHLPVEIVSPEKQFTVFFDDVRVPAANLIGTEGDGLRQVFVGLNPERIMGAANGVGVCRYSLAKAAAYAKDRAVWGAPIGTHQGIAHPLAECKIQADQAALMLQKATWLYDNGHDAAEAANMAKFACAEAALRCLDQAIQTHGGNGLSTEYGLATLWGSTRLFRTAPVSREMILNFVAQHSLGLPKSY